MDRLTMFEYTSKPGWLHRIDARAKLAGMVLLSLALLTAGPLPLMVASLVLAAALVRGPLPLKRLWQGLAWLAPLLLVVVAARALTETAGPHTEWGGVKISDSGLAQGFMFAWRLVLVAVLGVLLTATTAPSEVKAAVAWYLKPLPLVPAERVGTMLALLLRFIPLIFVQAGQTLDAQRARAVDSRKNPLYRLRCFALPFFRRTFLTADRIAEAMEARCYNDRRTPPQMVFTRIDGLFVCGTVGLAGLMRCL
jgi:energy-coupling factor transporter transmembrane protein EcfT